MGYDSGPTDSFYWNSNLESKLSFSLLPRRCHESGKLIWLKHGYMLTASWHGPGETIHERRWHDKNEHIIWKLKQ